ncbi:MAG TPA: hypothetical protein PKZ40_07145, partial [Anaerolineaceae bacterium]|nr:hypothetical protein [Anaerolineaceae bacterium]
VVMLLTLALSVLSVMSLITYVFLHKCLGVGRTLPFSKILKMIALTESSLTLFAFTMNVSRAIRDTCQTPFYPETLLILVEPALRLFAMNIPVVGVGLLGAMMLSGGKNE